MSEQAKSQVYHVPAQRFAEIESEQISVLGEPLSRIL
jgi:hypothetical protein